MQAIHVTNTRRFKSIDVFRGFTMLLLIGEFTGLYELMADEKFAGNLIGMIGHQLHHHPWNGLRFWDLIQPFFMFIVGLSLPFAINNRIRKGENKSQIRKHVYKRSALLFIMGWALYCIGPGKINFYFQNVLAQIGITYLIAFLIMDKSISFQILFSIVLLIISDALYRFFPVEGFNHAFVRLENFGTWLDMQYGGADLNGAWVSFNAVPTAAHTIWGVLVGQMLLTNHDKIKTLKHLFFTGIALILIGYTMDPFIPIIKRIATSSFVFVSGGWSIIVIAFLFWLIDVKETSDSNKWILFFSVVGMNSLFIYLFAHLNGADFIEAIVHPFSFALLGWTGELSSQILTSVIVWILLWGICYWMFRKKLFIKI